MTPLGIGPRDVVSLARHAQQVEAAAAHPVLVTGILAQQLADALAAGGDRSLVRTSGDPAEAGAFVRVVAGATTPDDEAQLRAATRALVPVVVVQTGIPSVRLPYVLATDIIEVPPGSGFPVEEIADAVAGALGAERAPLAARLPVLREAFERHRKLNAVVTAATLAALEPRRGAAPPGARALAGADALRPRGRGRRARHPATRAPRPRPSRRGSAPPSPPASSRARSSAGFRCGTVWSRRPSRPGRRFALATLAPRIGSVRSRS